MLAPSARNGGRRLGPRFMKARPSLKARGVQLLAQREHSRTELRRKLLRHAREDEAQAKLAELAASPDPRPGAGCDTALEAVAEPAPVARGAGSPQPDNDRVARVTPEAAVEAALDWLESRHYLDTARFIESRVHARAARYGNLRIRQELAQHGLTLSPEEGNALKASELDRAREVWRRKYGEPAPDAAGRARQMRFLAGRGFSPSVIRQVVQGDDDP